MRILLPTLVLWSDLETMVRLREANSLIQENTVNNNRKSNNKVSSWKICIMRKLCVDFLEMYTKIKNDF